MFSWWNHLSTQLLNSRLWAESTGLGKQSESYRLIRTSTRVSSIALMCCGRPTRVFRFYIDLTVESRIYELLQHKSQSSHSSARLVVWFESGHRFAVGSHRLAGIRFVCSYSPVRSLIGLLSLLVHESRGQKRNC